MRVLRLIWDRWNVAHIARHRVTPDEVEDVCRRRHAVRAGYRGRIILIGKTATGRHIAVILNPERGKSDVYYPVTARPADRKERKLYEQFAQEPEPIEEEGQQ